MMFKVGDVIIYEGPWEEACGKRAVILSDSVEAFHGMGYAVKFLDLDTSDSRKNYCTITGDKSVLDPICETPLWKALE